MKKTNKIFLQSSSVLATLITLAPMGMNVVANADDNSHQAGNPVINNAKNGDKAIQDEISGLSNGHFGNIDFPKTIGMSLDTSEFFTFDSHGHGAENGHPKESIFYSAPLRTFTDGWKPAYCLQWSKGNPTGFNEQASKVLTDEQMSEVIQAIFWGGNGINGQGTNKETQVATQCVIWTIVSGYPITPVQWGTDCYNTAVDPTLMNLYNQIMSKIKKNVPINQLPTLLGINGEAHNQQLANAEKQLTQMVNQEKQKMLQQYGFATEALDGSQSNSDSNETPESSSSNSDSSSTSGTAGLAKNAATPSSNAASATTEKPSAKNYSKYDNDLDNPNKKFVIHATKINGATDDGVATVDFANKLPDGTKVVQDGKTIQIKTPQANSSSNSSSSSSNASSGANGSSNASSASSSSASSNAPSASNGSSTVSSGDINQGNAAQTNKNGSEITVKENTPFTVELPKQQAFKTDGTATPDKPVSVQVKYNGAPILPAYKFGVQTYSGGGQVNSTEHKQIQNQVIGQLMDQPGQDVQPKDASIKPTDKLGMAYQPKASSSSTTTNTTGSQNQGQNQNENQNQSQQGKSATLANTQGNRFNITSAIVACLTALAGIFTGSLAYVLKRKRD